MSPARLAELLQVGRARPAGHAVRASARTGAAARRSVRAAHAAGRGNLVRQAISLLVHFPAAAAPSVDEAGRARARRPPGRAAARRAADPAARGPAGQHGGAARALARSPGARPAVEAGGRRSAWWRTLRPAAAELSSAIARLVDEDTVDDDSRRCWPRLATTPLDGRGKAGTSRAYARQGAVRARQPSRNSDRRSDARSWYIFRSFIQPLFLRRPS